MSTVTAAPPASGKHFIAGHWREGTGPTFESHNPAHWDEVVGIFPTGNAEDANLAVSEARKAFPGWRRTSRIQRADLFDQLARWGALLGGGPQPASEAGAGGAVE